MLAEGEYNEPQAVGLTSRSATASGFCYSEALSTCIDRWSAPETVVNKRLRRKKKTPKHTERGPGGLSYERSAPGAGEVLEFPGAGSGAESAAADGSSSDLISTPLITEQLLGKLHQHLEGKNFSSEEKFNAYLESLADKELEDVFEPDSSDPIARAQDLAYKAMEGPPLEAQRLARQAVALDPDCVDALVVRALDEEREAKRIAKLQMAVRAGEKRLGKEFFAENKGHFWGLLETRPYMRARHQLALGLMYAMRVREGMEHLEALLDLSPDDNLGAREDLLSAYLVADHVEAARDLAEEYSDDGSAFFEWARVLIYYLSREFDEAASSLARARRANKYVERYLLKKKEPPEEEPFDYIVGRDSEAQYCAFHLELPWSFHPAAWMWIQCGGQPGDGKYFGGYSMMKKGSTLI